jgi:tetratricopeptide (TPR) repeat protein
MPIPPSLSRTETLELHTLLQPEALAEIERLLAAPGPSPVLLLSGEPGCGRTGLLAAAARAVGGPVTVLPLDLAGYEEDPEGLGRFVGHQLARRADLTEADRAALLERVFPLVRQMPASLPGAALLSLLLHLDEAPGEVLMSAADPGRALSRLLAHLSREGRIVLHVTASEQLTDTLRRHLLNEARTSSGLLLALSCFPADRDDRVAPRAERVRLELQPLPSEDRAEPVKGMIDTLDFEAADRLQRFLDLAALCGENVPAEPLFHHLELEEEQREELLDLLDEELVEVENPPVFHDYQYGHPSFPGLLTYGFTSPRWNAAFLAPVPDDKRQRLASELMEFFLRSVPLHTRGMALLLLSLAGHARNAEARESFLLELRWSINEDETGELTDEIAAELADGKVTADALLGLVREAQGGWPTHRRWALLEALARREDLLSPALRPELHTLRAEVLRELGRAPEGLEEARRAVAAAGELYGPDQLETARPLNTLGILLRETGQTAEARETLERALALETRREPAGANTAFILANLGLVLRDLGEKPAALSNFQQALAIHRQAFGDVHPVVATDLGNLALLSRELGEPEQALQYLRPTVDIIRSLYGDAHPQTARALVNMADLLRELGETDGARLHLEAALTIDRQAFGDQHPAVAADLNNLALVERELGKHDEARQHLKEALEAATASLVEGHPLIAQLKQTLAEG